MRVSLSNVLLAAGALLWFVVPKARRAGLPDGVAIALMVIAVIALVTGIVLTIRTFRSYEQAMRRFAASHGWVRATPPAWVRIAGTWPLLGATRISTSSSWTGPWRGLEASSVVIDLKVSKVGPQIESTYQVVGLTLSGSFPRMQLLPNRLAEQAQRLVGAREIAFESADFNAHWSAWGEDAKRVHDIIHPRTMERLLRSDAAGLPIILDGGALWTWRAKPTAGKDLERMLNVLADVLEGVPAFVYEDLKARPVVWRRSPASKPHSPGA
jgi:hypothetical protein